MKKFFLIVFLCFSTSVFATPNKKPYQGDILVTDQKPIGAVCELWLELGGSFIDFSNLETEKNYKEKNKNSPFQFNTYHENEYIDKDRIAKKKYFLDDYFNKSDLLILYKSYDWTTVQVYNNIFSKNSKFNDLEKKIISLLYNMSTNAYEDLLSEKDFYILKKLIELGHEQSKIAHEKYDKILKNHNLKQTALFLSIACVVLALLSAVGYFLYKYRNKILCMFTKTKMQRLGIIFFIFTLVFMYLEESNFFYLDDGVYLFLILVPLVVSIFMILGIIDYLYKWVFEKNNN